jgi:hypothetical protein
MLSRWSPDNFFTPIGTKHLDGSGVLSFFVVNLQMFITESGFLRNPYDPSPGKDLHRLSNFVFLEFNKY